MRTDPLEELQKEIDKTRFAIVNCIADADIGEIDKAIEQFEKIDLEKPIKASQDLEKGFDEAQRYNKRKKHAEKVVDRPDRTVKKISKAKDFTPKDLVKLITLMKDSDRINSIVQKKPLLHKSSHGLMKFTILKYASKFGQHHIYLAELGDWIRIPQADQDSVLHDLVRALEHVTAKKMEARAKGKAEMIIEDFLEFFKSIHKRSKAELEAMKGVVVVSEFGSVRIDDIDAESFHIHGFPSDVWVNPKHINMALRFASKISEKTLHELDELLRTIKPFTIKDLSDFISASAKWKDEQFEGLVQFDKRFENNIKDYKQIKILFKKR